MKLLGSRRTALSRRSLPLTLGALGALCLAAPPAGATAWINASTGVAGPSPRGLSRP